MGLILQSDSSNAFSTIAQASFLCHRNYIKTKQKNPTFSPDSAASKFYGFYYAHVRDLESGSEQLSLVLETKRLDLEKTLFICRNSYGRVSTYGSLASMYPESVMRGIFLSTVNGTVPAWIVSNPVR